MRNSNWLENLTALIEERRNVPYKVGANDCCLFAADAILAMTGDDLAKDLRNTYSTEAEATAIVESYGGHGPLLTKFLGVEPKGPLCARRGDIVTFITSSGMETIGVCMGTTIASPGDDGLNIFNFDIAKQSWAVS